MKKISGLTPISGEIQGEDILVVNTAGGTRKITYAELCEAVRATLGVREVVESVNITEPGFLMDGKTVSDAFAQLNGNIEQLNSHRLQFGYEPISFDFTTDNVNHGGIFIANHDGKTYKSIEWIPMLASYDNTHNFHYHFFRNNEKTWSFWANVSQKYEVYMFRYPY